MWYSGLLTSGSVKGISISIYICVFLRLGVLNRQVVYRNIDMWSMCAPKCGPIRNHVE
jgi:hypothetical protein